MNGSEMALLPEVNVVCATPILNQSLDTWIVINELTLFNVVNELFGIPYYDKEEFDFFLFLAVISSP